MLKKAITPSFFSKFQKGVKIVLFVEIFAFLGSYGVWFRMNRDQEFRRYMNEKYPSILEGFYKFGEFFDKDALAHIREVDLATFEAKKKNSTTKSQ